MSIRTVVAYRYWCSNEAASALCDRGEGRPTQDRCSHCGHELTVATGQWAAFTWTPFGAYLSDVAVRTFPSHTLAYDWAAPRNLVVRFVPDFAAESHPDVTVLRGGP